MLGMSAENGPPGVGSYLSSSGLGFSWFDFLRGMSELLPNGNEVSCKSAKDSGINPFVAVNI